MSVKVKALTGFEVLEPKADEISCSVIADTVSALKAVELSFKKVKVDLI